MDNNPFISVVLKSAWETMCQKVKNSGGYSNLPFPLFGHDKEPSANCFAE
jgi:hypothetical protein